MEPRLATPILKLNDTFSSFQELRHAIERYERANRVQFWTRDAKRLHRAAPTVYEIVKDYPELEYCTIKLACIHGGKSFQPKMLDNPRKRKNRGTWKQDCKAEIFIKLNEYKNKLIISRLAEEHNHDIPTEEAFKQFPKMRRVSERHRLAKKREVEFRMTEKKLEEADIRLENIVKGNSLSRSNNFKRIAETLEGKFNCTVDLLKDGDFKVYGFFFQDSKMRKYFHLFPEILIIDGSYELLNINASIYILSIENSMGISNLIGVAVLTVEDQTSFDWMFERFKKRNPKWKETSIILSDQKTNNHKISSTYFPNSQTVICQSHTLHTFKKEVSQIQTINVTSTDIEESLDYFRKLTNANSEHEYNNILEDMEDSVSYPFMQYFYKKWHHLKNYWVRGLGAEIRDYVNIELEDPNSKLKSTLASCKTFTSFIDKFFLILYLKRSGLKNEFNKMIMKVYIEDRPSKSEKLYQQNLTRYACEKIKPYLSAAETETVNFQYETESSDVVCHTKSGSFVVSEFSCNCDFFILMKLPCEHILVYRKRQGLSLFDECLFSQRWTRRYTQNLFANDTPVLKDELEKTREEKFSEVEGVCLSLATLCSEVSSSEFEERMDLLIQLKRSWQNNEKVVIETAGSAMDVDDDKTEKIILEFIS